MIPTSMWVWGKVCFASLCVLQLACVLGTWWWWWHRVLCLAPGVACCGGSNCIPGHCLCNAVGGVAVLGSGRGAGQGPRGRGCGDVAPFIRQSRMLCSPTPCTHCCAGCSLQTGCWRGPEHVATTCVLLIDWLWQGGGQLCEEEDGLPL